MKRHSYPLLTGILGLLLLIGTAPARGKKKGRELNPGLYFYSIILYSFVFLRLRKLRF